MTKFNFIAPLNDTGYGQAAQNIAEGFVESKLPFNYCVIGSKPNLAKLNDSIATSITDNPDPKLPSIVFWHANALHTLNIPDRAKSIVYTTFEVDSLSSVEIQNLSPFKNVITALPSTQDVANFTLNRNDKFVPHGIFSSPYHFYKSNLSPLPDISDDQLSQTTENLIDYWSSTLDISIPQETRIFSSVGKFEKRKGYYHILDAADKPFATPIFIVALWNNPFIKFPWHEFHLRHFIPIKNSLGWPCYKKNNTTILLVPPVPTKKHVFDLMNKSDHYLSTSFAEGYNLPLFEAIAAGVPPVVFASHVYSDSKRQNSYLIDCLSTKINSYVLSNKVIKEPAIDLPFFDGSSSWRTYTTEDFVSCINSVLRTPKFQWVDRLYARNDLYYRNLGSSILLLNSAQSAARLHSLLNI